MKRFAVLIVLCLGPVATAAMTYSADRYLDPRYNGYRNATGNVSQYLDPEYLFAHEVEGYLEGTATLPDRLRFAEISAPSGNPASNTGWLYVKDAAGTSTLYFEDDAGTVTALGSGTFTGGNITSDVTMSNGVDILSSTTTAESTGIQGYADAGARKDALRVTNGATVALVLGAADVSFALASTGLDISTAGAISNATTITASGLVTGGGWTGTGNFSQGDGTGTFAVSSTGLDVSTAGAVSGVTTLAMTDDLSMANGKGVKSSTTTAQTVGVYGYDNDGAAYVGALVVTNGNAPATVLGNANGTTAITSSDWAISTTGAMTGIGAITTDGTLTYNAAAMTVYANEATTWTHATDGAADDWTLALTGATDSSIIVQSAGTGADTIKLNATAGGLDLDSATTTTIDAAGDAMTLTVASDGAADDLSLIVSGATDSSIILNSAGTGTDAVSVIATAGVFKAAADKFDFDTTNDMELTVTSNADGEDLLISQVGAQDASVTIAAAGTGADAIGLQASAGGVDIDAAATKDVTIDGGQVALASKDNAASAISLTANVGASETIVVTNTQGTDAGAVTATATAGGITLSAATAGKGITLTGEVYVKKGGDIASPAGGELDLTNGVYFDITGTNNITSIAAADSIAGRLIVLQFDAILTFTDGNNLKLAGNLVTSADDTIGLICDGTNWHEVFRSAN